MKTLTLLILFVCGSLCIAEPAPPKLRLDGSVKPLRQAVELTILPTQDRFSGNTKIQAEAMKPMNLIWINAKNLKIQKAEIQLGNETVTPVVHSKNEGFLGFELKKPVGPGKLEISVWYEGEITPKETVGLFRQKDDKDWYVFSYLEALNARRAYPCFDEPNYKIPWKFTFHIRKVDSGVSNAPILSEADEGQGMKRVEFAESKPIPSYLTAVAVGPFDFVDAGKAGVNHIPLRIITPKGKAKQARYAAEVSASFTTALENYFGIPYPYEKLDQIAVPEFGGAMENAALITFWQQGILIPPEEENIDWKRTFSIVSVHEIAHMWFGDLVTMAWYDDLWLNEAFASWLETKITDSWKPEWDLQVSQVETRDYALRSDSLISARKIHQPIETQHDIQNAYDSITYSKGEIVLDMFESWIGEERFRKGVQRYLKEHEWGNGTANDFLLALAAETDATVPAAFSTFLDQSGGPLISVHLECSSAPKLIAQQQQYLPLGSSGKSDRLWQIPFCVRYAAGTSNESKCTLLKEQKTEIELKGGACPDWILGNNNSAGYYRVLYEGDLLNRLLKDGGKQLSMAERVGLIGDLGALMENGSIPAATVMKMLPAFLKDGNPHLYSATIPIVMKLKKSLVPQNQLKIFRHYVQNLYGVKAQELGWTAKKTEDEQTRLLRPKLLRITADEGTGKELPEQALQLANRWFQDRSAVDPDMVETVLMTAAKNGDRSLFDSMVKEVKKTSDRRDLSFLFAGLGSFYDPKLLEPALNLVLDESLDIRESMDIVRFASENPETENQAYDFLKKNFDSLSKRMTENQLRYLPFVGAYFCNKTQREDLEAFLGKRVEQYTGAPRNLKKALEGIDLCIALRDRQEPSVAEFLKSFD